MWESFLKAINQDYGNISNAEEKSIYFLNVYLEKYIELNRKQQAFFPPLCLIQVTGKL